MPAKVSFNIIIPDDCELDQVMVYKYKDNDKPSVMFADNVEDYDTNPEFSDSDDDADYLPAIDEEDYDTDEDIFEDTPLSDREKKELQEELEKLIADQDLELEWEEYRKEN